MQHSETSLDLSIVIVSFNTRELLKSCLRSIFQFVRGITFEVIVIDNASQDGSPQMVKELFPAVRLIESDTNAGFARANNRAIREARGRILQLLNSDTALQSSPEAVVEYLSKHEDIGLLGCRILFGDGSLQHSTWRFPSIALEWYFFSIEIIYNVIPVVSRLRYRGINYNRITDTDCVSGCSLFIKRNVISLIGDLDERFFMYYEDSEYCFRIRTRTNFRTVYYPQYQVIHHHGKSGNKVNAALLSFKAARYYFQKTKGRKHASFFVAACRASWRVEYAVFSMINRMIQNRRVSAKADMFRQLLESSHAYDADAAA